MKLSRDIDNDIVIMLLNFQGGAPSVERGTRFEVTDTTYFISVMLMSFNSVYTAGILCIINKVTADVGCISILSAPENFAIEGIGA